MSYDIIPDRQDGQIISQEWFNVLQRTLYQDFVPRSAAGVVTDLAGTLGTSAIRFASAFVSKMILVGQNAVTLLSGATSAYTLTLPAALPGESSPFQVDNTGQLITHGLQASDFSDGFLTLDLLQLRPVSASAAAGETGESSGTGSTGFLNGNVTVSGTSVALVTTGRPVRVELMPTLGNPGTSQLFMTAGVVNIVRDGTTVASVKMPWRHFSFLDDVAAGSHTYVLTITGANNAILHYCSLWAYET